jgi:hypothetical protein
MISLNLDYPRTNMVTIGNLYDAHANQFIYSEEADRAEIFDLTLAELEERLEADEDIVGDCASTAEATAKDAGCPLGPLGYTGTELERMPHITLAEALIGDFIVFGAPPGLHVVWISQLNGDNPKVYGHGRPGFDEQWLQDLWSTTFPGKPITVLSLAPFLPASYHYDTFTAGLERNAVMKYDALMRDPKANRAAILAVRAVLRARRLTIVAAARGKNPLHPNWAFRDRWWRNQQLLLRGVQGKTVAPSKIEP